MSSSVCRIGCVGLLVGLMFVVGGCGKKQIDAKYARSHPSPELQSIAHMAEHPTLLERPIGVKGGRAVVGRPIENLLELRG